MATRKNTTKARKLLDARLRELKPASRYATPHAGWIRAIRDALGMSAAQLGRRLEVSGPAVTTMERSEREGTVGLPSLRRAAEALDCTVVYAFIPNSSLEDTVRTRAEQVLAQQLRRAHQTMVLEDQSVEMPDSSREEQLQAIIDSGRLWKLLESDK